MHFRITWLKKKNTNRKMHSELLKLIIIEAKNLNSIL